MKKLLALILALLMVVGMVACGAKEETAADGAAEGTAAETPAEQSGTEAKEFEATDEIVEADENVEYKEHIVVGLKAQLTTLDPTQKNNVVQNILYNCTHDTLINRNVETGEYEPGLALEWSWVDDVTLNLKLREGVVFHDGTDFNAYDVEATLGRSNNGLITNNYDHCDIISDYELNIVLGAPNVDWVFILSHNVSAICSAEAIAADPDNAYVGTGPWAVVNFTSGDSVEMEKNENYWGPLPATKKLTLRYYGEASARLIALENGEIDICDTVSATDLVYAAENENIVLENFVSSQLFYFCFNMQSEVGQDENLRKAVAYAIDRDSMVAAVGGGQHAYTMWGWNSLGYTTEFEEDYTYNVEKAMEYAALAEHKEFTLITSTAYQTLATVLQENLRAVGITMNIENMDSAGISSATAWGADHEAVIYGMSTNESGSDMYRLIAYGTAGNRANVQDPEDEMYQLQAASNAEFDEEKRIEILQDLQAYMHDNCIYYGLIYGNNNLAYTKGLENPGLRINTNYDFSMAQLPLN